MSDYRKAKSRGQEPTTTAKVSEASRPPPPPLSEKEKKILAMRRRAVYHYMPEFVEMLEDFQKEGLIDGWRNVRVLRVIETGEEF